MIRALSAAFLIACCAQPAMAQQPNKEEICTIVVPPMLTFIDQLTKIESSFAAMHGNMTPEEKAAFAKTKEDGEALTQAAKAYRSSFLAACAG